MDQKGVGEDMENDIKSLIKKNQTLLRKKGLLKRLLDDNMIKQILSNAGDMNVEGKEALLDEREKNLLEKLEEHNFDLDKTIEKIFEETAKKMEEENLQKNEVIGEVMSKDELPIEIEEKRGMKFVTIRDGDDGDGTVLDTRLMVASDTQVDKLREQVDRDDISLKEMNQIPIDFGQDYRIQTKAKMRKAPAKDSEELGDLKEGIIVTALGVETLDDENMTKRVLVKTEDGKKGWVSFVTDKGETLKKQPKSEDI